MARWYAPSLLLPPEVAGEISLWVRKQDWPEGTDLKAPVKYHTTLFYSPDQYGTDEGDLFMDYLASRTWDYEAWTSRVSAFSSGDNDGARQPVVLELHSFWLLEDWRTEMAPAAREHGIRFSEFEGGYKSHITVATLAPGVELPHMMPPHLHFKFQPFVKELHEEYDAMRAHGAA